MRYFSLSACLLIAVGSLDAQEPLPASILPAATDSTSALPERYVPHRAYDAVRNRFSDFETMLAELARADVVFLGEQHDDPRTHRLQLAVLEGLARRREGRVVLSLEMFERDVQPALDAYLAGTSTEAAFLAASRPWPNHRADYRPLVEFSRAKGWPVIAANVPRRLAQAVSRRGLVTLDSVPEGDRLLIASTRSCPRDAYRKRFAETMGDMSGHGMQMTKEQSDAMVQRFYEAQCLKDETMAESIVQARQAHNTLVVHANGSFHSDYRLGTAARVKRRLPKARIAVVSFVPVGDLDRADGKSRRKFGDWVVFTLETPKPEQKKPAQP